jgi:integrase
MQYTEVGAFMHQLRNANGVAARALELAILTATGTNELIQVRWSEFDLDLCHPGRAHEI